MIQLASHSQGIRCSINVRICPVVADVELTNSRDYIIEVTPRDCQSKWEVQFMLILVIQYEFSMLE